MSAFVAHANAEVFSPTPSEVMQKDDKTSNVRRLRLLKRHRTRLAALVEDAEGHAAVEIRNISQTGAGLLSARSFKGNEAISLHLPGGRTLKAIVRWRRFGFCGVEFETPLAFDDQILPALTAELGILRQTKASGKSHPEIWDEAGDVPAAFHRGQTVAPCDRSSGRGPAHMDKSAFDLARSAPASASDRGGVPQARSRVAYRQLRGFIKRARRVGRRLLCI